MTSKTKYGPPLKLFNILGASELRQSKLMVVLLFVLVVQGCVIGLLISMTNNLQKVNEKLANERIMYGFPNAEGVFVSEKQIPQRHIEGFVTWFNDNFYNFTPVSANDNVNEALRLMSSSLRVKQEENMRTLARQSKEQEITQVFARETPYTIEFEPGKGYLVSFRGVRVRATLNRVFSKKTYDIKLLIKPVKPSAHFEWAVVVDDFWVQEI